MSLIDRLRTQLDDETAGSFQLSGEDFALVTGADLLAAAESWRAALDDVPTELLVFLHEEHQRHARESHQWLTKYNRSLGLRIKGYVALGRRCDFAYPWPVVAVLGICQVKTGMTQMAAWGIAGSLAARVGRPRLERLTDTLADVLRRTNRGIFADSVPTVLFALRCHALREEGRGELAECLLRGPLPPLMDEDSRALAAGLFQDLALEDVERFRALADRTIVHFDREQAIFSHHMGAHRTRVPQNPPKRGWADPTTVSGPVVERGWRGPRLVFRKTALPEGFDMRDHEARVRVFGRVFVNSVVDDPDDYQVAKDWVIEKFGGG